MSTQLIKPNYIDLRITSHIRQISTVTNAPFIQISNQMASGLTATKSFPRIFSQLLQYLTQCSSFSAHRGALMRKTDLTSPAFSLKCVDFEVFIPQGETLELLEPGLTVARFSWTNHNSLPCIAANEITSFCIDNRLRQMTFFRVRQSGQRRGN